MYLVDDENQHKRSAIAKMVLPYNTKCKETLRYYNHQTIQFILNNDISICNHYDQINYKIITKF